MVKLKVECLEFLQHLLNDIADCEGGKVVTTFTDEGDVHISLETDIPVRLWCGRCKAKAVVKSKLMTRWANIKIR